MLVAISIVVVKVKYEWSMLKSKLSGPYLYPKQGCYRLGAFLILNATLCKALQAFVDGCDYIYQYNDDFEFRTAGVVTTILHDCIVVAAIPHDWTVHSNYCSVTVTWHPSYHPL